MSNFLGLQDRGQNQNALSADLLPNFPACVLLYTIL